MLSGNESIESVINEFVNNYFSQKLAKIRKLHCHPKLKNGKPKHKNKKN